MTIIASRPTPPEILATLARGRARRRRVIAAVLVALAVPSCLAAWRFAKYAYAESYLASRGYVINWRLDRENWRKGGSTSVAFASFGRGFGGPDRSPADARHVLWLHRVDRLDLSYFDGMADAELAFLAELPDLVVLNLDQRRGNEYFAPRPVRPTDVTMTILGGLRKLRDLNLARGQITDAGLAHLAGLSELRLLDLGETDVGDAGLVVLANLKKLNYVNLRGTKVTAAGAARLKLALPETDVDHESIPSPR